MRVTAVGPHTFWLRFDDPDYDEPLALLLCTLLRDQPGVERAVPVVTGYDRAPLRVEVVLLPDVDMARAGTLVADAAGRCLRALAAQMATLRAHTEALLAAAP
jgi:hypothetical protein